MNAVYTPNAQTSSASTFGHIDARTHQAKHTHEHAQQHTNLWAAVVFKHGQLVCVHRTRLVVTRVRISLGADRRALAAVRDDAVIIDLCTPGVVFGVHRVVVPMPVSAPETRHVSHTYVCGRVRVCLCAHAPACACAREVAFIPMVIRKRYVVASGEESAEDPADDSHQKPMKIR